MTPVFIADTCIGGLSVVKSLWESGTAANSIFLADYAINPLGVKSDREIAAVAENWLQRAAAVSDTLVIACNTLSIRYHQLQRSSNIASGPAKVVSMTDCFDAMVNAEADRLSGRRILVIGTAFTASQMLYSDILHRVVPEVSVSTVAATELERKIARFGRWEGLDDPSITIGLRQALEDTDVAILACTCFPMVVADLQGLFPDVVFLDPGAWCSGLLEKQSRVQAKNLSLEVSGKTVSRERVFEYARTYLDVGCAVSIAKQGSE